MFKNFKLTTLVTLSLLTIVNCGGSSKSIKESIVDANKEQVTISGLKDLRATSKLDNLGNSGMSKTVETASNIESNEANSLCQNGFMHIVQSQNNNVIGFEANNCTDGNSNINGSATVTLTGSDSQNPTAGTLKIKKSLSVKDEQNTFSIEKDGTLTINQDTDIQDTSKIDVMATFKSKINGMAFNVSGLSFNIYQGSCEFMNNPEDCKEEVFITVNSGEFNVGKYYFKIDTSKTNRLVSNEDGLKSGTIYLVDGVNHKAEIMIENKALIFKIDENGDGTYSNNEIIK